MQAQSQIPPQQLQIAHHNTGEGEGGKTTNYKIGVQVQDETNKKPHSKSKGVHEEKIGNHNTTKHDVIYTSGKMKIQKFIPTEDASDYVCRNQGLGWTKIQVDMD